VLVGGLGLMMVPVILAVARGKGRRGRSRTGDDVAPFMIDGSDSRRDPDSAGDSASDGGDGGGGGD
jgi:hypothetical protein